MRRWLWAFWAVAAGLSVGLYRANVPLVSSDPVPNPIRPMTDVPPRNERADATNKLIHVTDAGSEVLRRAGFFDIRSGSSEYLRTGVVGRNASSETLSKNASQLTSSLIGANDGPGLQRADVPRPTFGFALTATPSSAHVDEDRGVSDSLVAPVWLALDEPENVYPEIMPQRMQENLNGGGVNFGLNIDWLSDYVYRGVDQNTPGRRPENSLEFTAQAKFDLGKLPHPFIGLFVNVYNSDPVSRFEEVRPFLGAEWTLKPITISAGYISYIYPNRKSVDTQEVFTKIALDDSRLFRTATPIFSPYIYGAYDTDLYKGFYLEAGARHDFVFEDFGFTFSPLGDVGYVANNPHFAITKGGRNWGLQHYDVGAIANYSLNHLLSMDHRHGEWSVNGYLYYTGRFDNLLRADNLIWGGVGLEFRY